MGCTTAPVGLAPADDDRVCLVKETGLSHAGGSTAMKNLDRAQFDCARRAAVPQGSDRRRDRAGDANAVVDIVAPVKSIACVPASFTQSLPHREEVERVLSFRGSYEALDTEAEELRCVDF